MSAVWLKAISSVCLWKEKSNYRRLLSVFDEEPPAKEISASGERFFEQRGDQYLLHHSRMKQ